MRNKPPSQKGNPTPDDYVTEDSWGVDPPPEGALRPLTKQTTVLPYRGQEYHGVNPNLAGDPPDMNTNVFDAHAQVPVPQEKDDLAIRPVPVRLVKSDDDWEQTQFRTFQNLTGTMPIRVAGRMLNRTALRIRNDGNVAVYISGEPQPNVVNSWNLTPGDEISINATNAVFAVAIDGSSQPLSTYIEYTVASRKAQE